MMKRGYDTEEIIVDTQSIRIVSRCCAACEIECGIQENEVSSKWKHETIART
jgi:hypothetical protein